MCLSPQTSRILSRQKYACRDKFLSRQKYACRGRIFVSRQIFVATHTCLSRQRFCRDKHTFVATKMILVAAPASDNIQPSVEATLEQEALWRGLKLTVRKAHKHKPRAREHTLTHTHTHTHTHSDSNNKAAEAAATIFRSDCSLGLACSGRPNVSSAAFSSCICSLHYSSVFCSLYNCLRMFTKVKAVGMVDKSPWHV